MNTEKKCPHCGAWTTWDKRPTDRCTECKELLDEPMLLRLEKIEKQEKEFYDKDFFRIREEDNFLMIVLRRAAWVLHLIFGVITWFFLWVFSTTSG